MIAFGIDPDIKRFIRLLARRANAPVNSSCAHPPPGNCGAFARIVSPGGRALAYPRATPGLLTHTWFLTRNPNDDDFIGKDQ